MIAKVVTEVVVAVSVVVSMTETILVILFQLEIIFHPEIASSCPRKHPQFQPLFFRRSLTKKDQALVHSWNESPKPTTRALVMSSFPEQNDPHYSKKIPLICSKFRFSDYISIVLTGCPPLGLFKPRGGHPSKIHVSTVRIRLPDRKVLFDSFVKRKLRLPMSRGHVLFLEFFRIYSIKNVLCSQKNWLL